MKSGFIYFLSTPVGDREGMKIGFTTGNPLARLSALQTGCPTDLELLGYLPGTLADEHDLHRRCNPHKIRGEWYDIEGEAFHAMLSGAQHYYENPL